MSAACFVCSECGHHDVAEHVVLSQPCPACGEPDESMTLVQCQACGDPLVPDSDWSFWSHGVYKLPECERPPAPILAAGMRVVFGFKDKRVDAAIHKVVGRVEKIYGSHGRTFALIVGSFLGESEDFVASLRTDGQWWLRGRSRGWGCLVPVPGRS